MRVELHEAIRALSQYLSSDTAYPFLVAANASSDLKELVRALPTRVHTVSMSDYCADDSLPDEDAVFNDLLNAGKPILLKGVGEQIMLSGEYHVFEKNCRATFPSEDYCPLPQSGNRTGTSATAKHKIRKQSLV